MKSTKVDQPTSLATNYKTLSSRENIRKIYLNEKRKNSYFLAI